MGSASLTFRSATTNSAVVQYSAFGFVKPNGSTGTWKQTSISSEEGTRQTRNMEKTVISYGELSYKWNFGASNQSGIYTLRNLSPGEPNTIRAKVTVTCEKLTVKKTRTDSRTRTYTPPEEGETEGSYSSWSSWSEGNERESETNRENYPVGSADASLVIFTKPNPWAWSKVAPNSTIGLTLFASEWNDLIEQCKKYKSWQQQSSVTVSVPRVKSGDLITGDLYNSMAQACGVSQISRVGREWPIISANLFITLANAVS